ncbi:MAG: DNA mismatch repair endonuclease MutH [Gammaproteobacteria bacterium]|nr:DNA mismatch repair endonuclease MutH [Gammaproteobacteria bacterium]
MIAEPASLPELMDRAQRLGGRRLGEIAAEHQLQPPDSMRRAKGWAGQIVELALGATSGSLPQPDFPALGVELKTLPIGSNGRPSESTFVCSVTLFDSDPGSWQQSLVWHKLRRVLWVPIEAAAEIPLAARQVGRPFLWEPDAADEAVLRADWEELMELVHLGQLGELSASLGTYLQIRPKAANARALTGAVDADGAPAMTLPRGFYLRATLTARLLHDATSATAAR